MAPSEGQRGIGRAVATQDPSVHADFYVAGGTLRADAPSYIPRQADEDLYAALSRGEFCYVLTSRQMGKSSLMVRTAMRLRDDSATVVVLDLTSYGQNVTPEQWYFSLLTTVGQRLDIEDELEDFWADNESLTPLHRWMEAFRQVVLARLEGRVVVFVDEIDVVQSLPFSAGEFFAGIRECYTRRAQDPEFERITFCLVGVATPSDLIEDPLTTPFNVGTRVDLGDFRAHEAARLAEGLGRDEATAESLVGRILHWTGGHPYLTQRLCAAAADDATVIDGDGVDRLCPALFFSERAQEQDDNLLFVRNQMLHRDTDHASLLGLYDRVRRGKDVRYDETDPFVNILRLAGIARVDGGSLAVRNRIYERVFDRAWVVGNMPDAELRRQKAAFRRGLLQAAGAATAILAVVAALAVLAKQQAGRAEGAEIARTEQLARTQAATGQRLLEAGDVSGLLVLAQARETAEDSPLIAAAIDERWAIWHWQIQHQLLHVVGQDGPLTAMTFSPDGRLFATASSDGTAQLWDVESGKPHGPPLKHGSPIGSNAAIFWEDFSSRLMQFSPDSRLVALGSADGRISVWNCGTGQLHGPVLSSNGEEPYKMAFSPSGVILAVTAREGRDQYAYLWAWDTDTGEGVRSEESYNPPATFLGDGSTIAAGLFLPTVIETASAKTVWQWDEIPNSWDRRGDVTAIGRFNTGNVFLFDPKGDELHRLSISPITTRGNVRLSSDGARLATGSSQGIRIWDTKTGAEIGSPLPHDTWVTHRSFNADASLIATATGSVVWVWDVETSSLAADPISHPTQVANVEFHPSDPYLLATRAVGATASLWNVAIQQGVTTLAEYGKAEWRGGYTRTHITFSGDGAVLATTDDDDSRIDLWDSASLTRLDVTVDDIKPGADDSKPGSKVLRSGIGATALNHDGSLLAVSTLAFTIASKDADPVYATDVRLIDTTTGRSAREPVPYSNTATALAFLADETLLAGLGTTGEGIHRLNPYTGEQLGESFKSLWVAHAGHGGGIGVDPTGRRLATSSHTGAAQLWDLATGDAVGPTIKHDGRVDCVRFSPDGELFATASEDNTVQLWKSSTGERHGPLLTHPSRRWWVSFSPDGRYIISGGDGDAQIWDVETGDRVGPPLRHNGFVTSVEFNPNGGNIVAGVSSTDVEIGGAVYVWELPAPPKTLDEMRLKTWVATGLRQTASGVEAIPWDEWQKLRERLSHANPLD